MQKLVFEKRVGNFEIATKHANFKLGVQFPLKSHHFMGKPKFHTPSPPPMDNWNLLDTVPVEFGDF